jgi:hypothetical protein
MKASVFPHTLLHVSYSHIYTTLIYNWLIFLLSPRKNKILIKLYPFTFFGEQTNQIISIL